MLDFSFSQPSPLGKRLSLLPALASYSLKQCRKISSHGNLRVRDETRIPLRRTSTFAKATEDDTENKMENKLICANGFTVSVLFILA